MKRIVYTIETNGVVVHESGSVDKSKLAITASLSMELNKSGSLRFTLPPSNAAYKNDSITLLVPPVYVYRTITNSEGVTTRKLIWKGRVIEKSIDFYGRPTFTCEGWLSVLRDTLVRPEDNYDYRLGDIIMNPGYFFNELITKHNNQMDLGWSTIHDAGKKFTCEVSGFPADESIPSKTPLARPVGNDTWYTTLDYIQSIFIENEVLGGFIWLEDTKIYYVSDVNARETRKINQKIELGKNLLDFSASYKASDIATMLVPTGKNGRTLKDGTEIYDGKFSSVASEDWMQVDETDKHYVEQYGKIYKHIEFPDIDSRENLLTSTRTALLGSIISQTSIELTAIDLSLLGADEDEFETSKYVEVIDDHIDAHGWYLCSSVELDLCNPANNRYKLGFDPTLVTNRFNHLINAVGANNFLAFNNFDRYYNNKYRVIYGGLIASDEWNGTIDLKLWKSYREVHFEFTLYGINNLRYVTTASTVLLGRLSRTTTETSDQWYVGPYEDYGYSVNSQDFYPEAVIYGTANNMDQNNPMSFQIRIGLDGTVRVENKKTIVYNEGGSSSTVYELLGKTISCSMTWTARVFNTEALYTRRTFTFTS